MLNIILYFCNYLPLLHLHHLVNLLLQLPFSHYTPLLCQLCADLCLFPNSNYNLYKKTTKSNCHIRLILQIESDQVQSCKTLKQRELIILRSCKYFGKAIENEIIAINVCNVTVKSKICSIQYSCLPILPLFYLCFVSFYLVFHSFFSSTKPIAVVVYALSHSLLRPKCIKINTLRVCTNIYLFPIFNFYLNKITSKIKAASG